MADVFEEVEEEEQLTLKGCLAVMVSNPGCPSWAKKIDVTGAKKANVSYRVALNFVLLEIKKDLATCHLRETLEQVSRTSNVNVSTGGLQIVKPDKEIEEVPIKNGYFVPDGRDNAILPSWVSDAVGFQMTSVADKRAEGIKNNTVTPAIEKSLKMAEQSFDASIPSNFGCNPITNSKNLFAMYVRPKLNSGQNYTLPLAHAQMSSTWSDHKLRGVKGVPHARVKDYVFDDGKGNLSLPLPSMCLQPPGAVVSQNFYKVYDQHKKVRGSDKRGPGMLSAGYYLASMSRAMDRTLTTICNIVTILEIFKVSTVVFDSSDVNENVTSALYANNFQVFVLRTAKVQNKYYTCIDLRMDKYPANSLLYSENYFCDSGPTVSKKGVIGKTLESFNDTFQTFTTCPNLMMTNIFLLDYHEKYEHFIVPSMSAHTGRVLLVNKKLSIPTPVAKMFARATIANKYKTAFPVRRVPFFTQDPYCPNCLHSGIKLLIGTGEDDFIEYEYGDVAADDLRQTEFPDFVFESPTIKVVPPAPKPAPEVPIEDPEVDAGVGEEDDANEEFYDDVDLR